MQPNLPKKKKKKDVNSLFVFIFWISLKKSHMSVAVDEMQKVVTFESHQLSNE